MKWMRTKRASAFAMCIILTAHVLGCGTDEPLTANSPLPEVDAGVDTAPAFDAGDDTGSDADFDVEEDADPTPDPTEVETAQGAVTGVIDETRSLWKYLGIPYAAPPTGELRWQAPHPPQVRSERLDAHEIGPACPQNQEVITGASLPWDEDCLTLNVWRPAELNGPLPVMVWIHGGAFIVGGSNQHVAGKYLYDGASLAAEGVIVVTLNYRLGALGFLAHDAFETTNFGLLDQLAALEWIKANIEAFGGDPEQVTIFGESAGAVSICALMTSSRGTGLFHRAILQSGYCPEDVPTLTAAREQGERLSRRVGCGNAVDQAQCLRGKPVSEILDALTSPVNDWFANEAFGPILDGELLSQSPAFVMRTGQGMDIPMIMGVNADEGTVFMRPRSNLSAEAYVDLVEDYFEHMADEVLTEYPVESYDFPWLGIAEIIGDLGFVCPTRWAVEAHSGHGRQTYHYHFTHVTVPGELYRVGAFHGSEIPFIFNTFGVFHPTPEEVELAQTMRAFWLDFARGEDLDGTHDVAWPSYDTQDDASLEFSSNLRVVSGWRAARCAFWKTILGMD